ncbi:MAG: type II toxin-antitoxin system VapC family toxin [Candidatus Omnitrophica bacterium]|nr:type II toxin-antitoxin system VapC family toxin [Candidatus Omnitrophota bacterium]MBU4477829.1 type II toxin-antitoxin system VapC family toxin [Candidatus Omnitrophota bacterium]MCG2703458.1 type II toxin-antitoxin system VapC family toxin [Candidatus Omnitrophota bacterium]
MDKNYVLDTSAIFVFTQSEEGSDTVEEILSAAKKGKCSVYISFITLMESYYITWQKAGRDIAKEFIVLIKSLPLEIVESNERLVLSAGRIKANHKLSLADSIIAATAIEKSATLVHKDPELEAVSQYVNILTLPYKVPKK